MREIVLDSNFVHDVQELDPGRDIPKIVRALAKALDVLPADMAEDVIFHSLATSSLGGRQLDQEELVASLIELWRIRAEKGDEFCALPTTKWTYLDNTPKYKAVNKIVELPLEMGLILHTISGFLKTYTAQVIDEAVRDMENFKKRVQELITAEKRISKETIKVIYTSFESILIRICCCYVDCESYIQAFSYECDNVGEFEIAFADLFILMANEHLTYV